MNTDSNRFGNASQNRRGAISKGCLLGLAALGVPALVLVIGIGVAISSYNGLARGSEDVTQKWAQVENQYKRRFDLVPNLVETVKGAANFEQSTITQVTEARASVGQLKLPEGAPNDPAQLAAYMKAQEQLGGALSRLLVVSENYPQLKASANFLALQDQLEGTENRIAVAREDYTLAIRGFNTRVRSFPGNVLAGMYGFETLPQLTVPQAEQANPKVDFGAGK